MFDPESVTHVLLPDGKWYEVQRGGLFIKRGEMWGAELHETNDVIVEADEIDVAFTTIIDEREVWIALPWSSLKAVREPA